MKKTRATARQQRHKRIRKLVKGTKERPRLVVHRSLSAIYAQIIDDKEGKTLVSDTSLKLKSKDSGVKLAEKVGESIAKKALDKKITKVCFDRSGYKYHGKIKALAEAARNAGLIF